MLKSYFKKISSLIAAGYNKLSPGSRKLLLATIIFVLAVIIIAAFLLSYFNRLETHDQELVSQGLPIHDCTTSSFSQKVDRGESVTFDVKLKPSRFWREYRIKLGGLPDDVTGNIDETEGRGSGQARITFNVGEKAQVASYGIAIVYEEKQGEKYVPSYCRFNLIIKEPKKATSTNDVLN